MSRVGNAINSLPRADNGMQAMSRVGNTGYVTCR